MGVFSGPDVLESGLVFSIDAGNSRGFDKQQNLLIWSNKLNRSHSTPVGTGYYGGGYFDGWQNNPADITESNDGYGTYYTTTNSLVWSAYYTIVTAPFTVYTISFFAKSNTVANIRPRLYSNTIATTSTGEWQSLQTGGTLYDGGWRKFVFVMPANVANNPEFPYPQYPNGHSIIIELSTGTGFSIKNIQVEEGTSATDYYETTSTAKNRGSTLIDMTGGGNNATLVNGVGYNNLNGGFLVFDGTDDYVRISSASYLNSLGSSDFTVSMWVYRATNPPGGNGEMLYQSATLDNGFLIGISDTGFRIELRDNQSTNGTVAGVSNIFTAGIWNNVVFTKQGTTYTGYSQGISRGSFTSYQDVGTNSGFVDIGRVDWWGPGNWEGRIANTSIYNRALTAAEVRQNFNASKSRYGL